MIPLRKFLECLKEYKELIGILVLFVGGALFKDIKDILEIIIWPFFLYIVFRTEWIKQCILEILKGRKIDIDAFGVKLKIAQKDVEKNLKIAIDDINNSICKTEKIYDIVPHTTTKEIEEVVEKFKQLEKIFGFITEDIKDIKYISLLKCMGGYYFAKANFEESLRFYQIAKQIIEKESEKVSSEHASIYSNIGFAYLHFEKNISESLTHFKKSIEISDNFPWSYVGLCCIYNKYSDLLVRNGCKIEDSMKCCSHAIGNFKRLLIKNPADYLSLLGISTVYQFLGEYDKEMEYLEKSIKYYQYFAPTHINKATCRLNIELEKTATFTITNESLEKIKLIEELPEDISAKLEDIKNQPIEGKEKFIKTLKNKIGGEQNNKYEIIIKNTEKDIKKIDDDIISHIMSDYMQAIIINPAMSPYVYDEIKAQEELSELKDNKCYKCLVRHGTKRK